MPTDYAGNPAAFPDPIVIPSNGDDADATSVNTALEALADRDAYLAARLPAFASTTLGSDYTSIGDAVFHQVATISLPAFAATFMFGGTIRLELTNNNAGFVVMRIRSSTSYGVTGTIYDEATFQTASYNVMISVTPIVFTTMVTGTHLYLEARDNGGGGFVRVQAESNLFAMWVRT